MNKAVEKKWPRKAFRNKIYRFVAASTFCYLFSIVFLSEFSTSGAISIPQGGAASYHVYGEDAKGTILVFAILGSVFALISIYYYVQYKVLINTNRIPQDKPLPEKYVICNDCDEIFEGYLINNDVCPNCNGKTISTDIYRARKFKKNHTKRKYNKIWKLFISIFFLIFSYLIFTQINLYFKINECREKGGRYFQEIGECYKTRYVR